MGTNSSNRMVVCEANRANGVREVVVDKGLHRVTASEVQGKGTSSSTSVVTIGTRKLCIRNDVFFLIKTLGCKVRFGDKIAQL